MKHIGFIMDGNGRWAERRGLSRTEGHRAGVEALKRVLTACAEKRVAVVSVYAFSTENWKRPPEEVNGIFKLIAELNDDYFGKEEISYRVNFFGATEELPASVKNSIKAVAEKTKKNRGMIVNILLNYGGRAEIVRAVKQLVADKKEITEESLSSRLYTGRLPDPDLIVRTAGEKRLSNFMTFQSAYSELLFWEKYWPDMTAEDVESILAEYGKRKRRFGGL
ncbi:MAG: di-trans,poly-cis-decaprenylcistransferase [Clostridiales bacterium]|jgi:undecaprenyl diphosphate synthase|nr:di-trans,poly-cis-decaprenylcistransferase [Clostridiales bacterium]